MRIEIHLSKISITYIVLHHAASSNTSGRITATLYDQSLRNNDL